MGLHSNLAVIQFTRINTIWALQYELISCIRVFPISMWVSSMYCGTWKLYCLFLYVSPAMNLLLVQSVCFTQQQGKLINSDR